MPVGDERQCRRDVKRLANAHKSTQPIEMLKVCGVAHEICHCRPNEQTAHNELLSAHAVGYHSCKGAYNSVYPKENGHQCTESLSFVQFGDVGLHSLLHCGEHLTVHVIQKGHNPEQCHDHPRVKLTSFHQFLLVSVFLKLGFSLFD